MFARDSIHFYLVPTIMMSIEVEMYVRGESLFKYYDKLITTRDSHFMLLVPLNRIYIKICIKVARDPIHYYMVPTTLVPPS